MCEEPRVREIGAAGTPCRIPGWVSLCPGACACLNVPVCVRVRVWNPVCAGCQSLGTSESFVHPPTHSFIHFTTDIDQFLWNTSLASRR